MFEWGQIEKQAGFIMQSGDRIHSFLESLFIFLFC